jgi:hypothetical protein
MKKHKRFFEINNRKILLVVILDEQVQLIYLNRDNFFVQNLLRFSVGVIHHLLKFVLMSNTNMFEKQ